MVIGKLEGTIELMSAEHEKRVKEMDKQFAEDMMLIVKGKQNAKR
jgi:hypothetical protein